PQEDVTEKVHQDRPRRTAARDPSWDGIVEFFGPLGGLLLGRRWIFAVPVGIRRLQLVGRHRMRQTGRAPVRPRRPNRTSREIERRFRRLVEALSSHGASQKSVLVVRYLVQ